jgi:murein DD-endopeptidase MepM/ murein hydrolase activator NlpD
LSQTTNFKAVSSEVTEWATYTDPRFDFSVSYPADWIIIPREDSYGVGGTLTFVSSNHLLEESDSHIAPPKIEIGMYLVARDKTLSLKEWTDRYNELSEIPDFNEIKIRKSSRITVDRTDSLHEEGFSSLTEFQYVNISRGDIVWFIWSNNSSKEFEAIFSQMLDSFKFGKNTPNTLKEANGSDFQPFPLNGQQGAIVSNLTSVDFFGAFGDITPPLLISSSWRSPLNNGPFDVRCDSSYHSGFSNHAIDIPRPAGTLVVGANTGDVYFAGWDTSGYGNLVKARTGSLEAFYAHLQSIDWTSQQQTNPWRVTKHSSVGWVGNTGGTSTGNHLHFHVRNVNNNASVDLTGMTTFSPTAGLYPESGNPCGTIKYP